MKSAIFFVALLLTLLIYMMCRVPSSSTAEYKPGTDLATTTNDPLQDLTSTATIRETSTTTHHALQQAAQYEGPTVSISMIYSGEKSEWVRKASSNFTRQYPAYQVSLTEQSSFATAQDIIEGYARPDVWSPASHMVVSWFLSEWEFRLLQREGAKHPDVEAMPLILAGEDAPKQLVRSPIVFMAWESSVPGTGHEKKDWKEISKSIGKIFDPETSPSGRFDIGHTDPSRANSGIQTLYLMALQYYGYETTELTLEQLWDDKLRDFLHHVESGIEDFPESTRTLTANMFRFGPSRYQLITTYENLALKKKIQSWKVPGPFGKLLIGYPKPTMWSDHPAVLLRPRKGDKKADQKLAAARLWVDFLRSEAEQKRAMDYGFRPSVLEFDVNDPDSILYRVPADNELTIVESPGGSLIWELLKMWHTFQTGQKSLKVRHKGRLRR